MLIEVIDPITGKSLSRTVHLDAAPLLVRPRLLALAVVELVTASWVELEVNPNPSLPPASGKPSADARAAAVEAVRARVPALAAQAGAAPSTATTASAATVASSGASEAKAPGPVTVFAPESGGVVVNVFPGTAGSTASSAPRPSAAPPVEPDASRPRDLASRNRIEAVLATRRFLSSGIPSVGVGGRYVRRVNGVWGLAADLVGEHGEVSVSPTLGSITVDSVSAGVAVVIGKDWTRVAVEASAGVRAGGAKLTGVPATNVVGGGLVSPWGGPMVGALGRAVVVRPVSIEIGGEAGEAPFPARGLVQGQGQAPVQLGGVWLAGHGGLAVSF